eukprot:1039669-Pleurochrysis_carterae.AAC.1
MLLYISLYNALSFELYSDLGRSWDRFRYVLTCLPLASMRLSEMEYDFVLAMNSVHIDSANVITSARSPPSLR